MASKYAHLRAKARELRQKGYTLTDIIDMLKMPEDMLNQWIQTVEILEEYKRPKHDPAYSDAQRNRDQRNSERFAEKRQLAYEQGMAEAPELLKNYSFRDFVVLYLAEGYKRNRNSVSIANSDPNVIILSQYWIMKLANSNNVIEYRLQFHIDQDEDEIKNYWAKILSLQPEQIKTQRKSNSGQLSGRKFRSEHGVLTISVSDTYFRSKLQAWMDYLRKQWVDVKRD